MFGKETSVTPSATERVNVKRLKSISLRSFLAFAILSFGLFTVGTTILLVLICYSPVPNYDQWSIIASLAIEPNPFSLKILWAQHNEHRLLIGRLLEYADLLLLGHRNISLLIEIFLVQVAQVAVLVGFSHYDGRLRGPLLISSLGFVAFCCFCPLQLDNFIWGFQIVFVLSQLGASCAFASAAWHAILPDHDKRKRIALLICLFSAFVAEASLASGVLVWPLLFILARGLRFSRRKLWIIAIAGSLAIAAYLIGYHSPPHDSNPINSIRQPGRILKYLITYLAVSWDASLPNVSSWPLVSESLTFCAIALTIAGMISVFLRKKTIAPADTFLLANMTFCVGTGAITALGRLRFGSGQAVVSRYQTVALIFWACLALLLARHAAKLKKKQMIAAQLFTLLLLASTVGRWKFYKEYGVTRRALLTQGWAALVRHSLNDPSVGAALFPVPQALPPWYHYLRSHHLEPIPVIQSAASVQLGGNHIIVKGYRTTNSCLGSIKTVDSLQPNLRSIHGSALNRETQSVLSKIALVNSQGRIEAYAPSNASLPNKQQDYLAGNAQNNDWAITVNLPGPGIYYAFILDNTSRTACPLGNELQVE